MWCVPVALDRAYSYRVPAGMTLEPGDVVAVPLGPNEYVGVVWGEGDPRPGLHNKLKDVDAKLDVPPLRESCASSSIGCRNTRWARAARC